MDPEEIRIPEWITEQCIAHRGQFVLRVFSVGGDRPLKCNAEFTYQSHFLTPVEDSPDRAMVELKLRMAGAAKQNAEAWAKRNEAENLNE